MHNDKKSMLLATTLILMPQAVQAQATAQPDNASVSQASEPTPVAQSTPPGAVPPQATQAAPAADAQASGGEIIVTGRKRSERLVEVPATIDVFTAKDLAPSGNYTITDLSTRIPNFFITSPRITRISATMRGLGVPGVGLYIDGVYQPSDVAFAIPLFDVARVEVLKGPQGTLYGRNAYSGAISYVTRPPSDYYEGEIDAEVGNAGTERGSATLAGPIVADLIDFRVSGSIQQRTGWRKYTDGSPADRDNYQAASARLLIKPAHNLKIDLKYTYVNKQGPSFLYYQVTDINDKNGRLLIGPVFGSATGALAGQRPESRLLSNSVSGKVTYSAPGFDLISTTAYNKIHFSYTADIDISPPDIFAVRGPGSLRDFSEELRAQSTGTGPIKWLVGAYYDDGATNDCSDCKQMLGGTALGGTSIVQGASPVFYHGYAAFADLEYKFGDHVVLGAGARFDDVKQTLRTASGVTSKGNFHGFQPKVTARYMFTPDTQVYGSITKGFTQGGFNSPLAGTGSPLETYPNQSLWQYEVGFKSAFDDHRGNISIALYDINALSFNAIATVPTPLGPRIVTSPVGKVKSYGVEVDANYRVTRELELDVSGGYDRAYPTVLSPAVAPGVGNVGEQIQRAPLWTYRAGATYTHPLSGEMSFELNGAVSGVGPTHFCGESAVFGPCPVRDAYTLVDASVSLVWQRYRVSLFARNLFNTTYVSDFESKSALAQFGSPAAGVVYGDPRYWGIRASAKF